MAGIMKLGTSGHSWLLTGVAGDALTKGLASLIGGAVLVAFVAASGGLILQAAWWRPLAVAASVASIVLIVAMWDGLPTSPAIAALAFDAVVLVALVIARWPSEDVIGAWPQRVPERRLTVDDSCRRRATKRISMHPPQASTSASRRSVRRQPRGVDPGLVVAASAAQPAASSLVGSGSSIALR